MKIGAESWGFTTGHFRIFLHAISYAGTIAIGIVRNPRDRASCILIRGARLALDVSPGSAWEESTLISAALLTLLPFAAYYRLWLTGPGAAYLAGDTNGTYWSDLAFLYRAIVHGQLPLWNPFERGGMPAIADPEAGVLYPVNWALAALGAAFGGVPFVLIEIKACLHLAIGGAAMFVFSRRRGLSPSAAVVGGVVYELGPFTIGHAYYSFVWPPAWLPAAMAAADWLLEGGGALAAAAVAAGTFLVVVAGSPPTAFYCALIAVPYFCVRAAGMVRREGLRPFLARVGGPLATAGLLTVVSCYPNVRATFEAMQHSERAVRTFAFLAKRGGFTANSVIPARLILRGYHAPDIYLGFPAPLLAVVGAVRAPRRAEAATFALLAVFGFALMLGDATPLLRWLFDWVPPFPALSQTACDTCSSSRPLIALPAAHGFDALFELRPCSSIDIKADTPARAWIGAVVALLIAIDLGSTVYDVTTTREGRFDPSAASVSAAWVPRLVRTSDAYRVYSEFGLPWRPGSRLGLRDMRGYTSPLTMKRLFDVYGRLREVPQILALFNVKWLLYSAHPYRPYGMKSNFVKSVIGVPGLLERDEAVFELEDPAPYAYWVGAYGSRRR